MILLNCENMSNEANFVFIWYKTRLSTSLNKLSVNNPKIIDELLDDYNINSINQLYNSLYLDGGNICIPDNGNESLVLRYLEFRWRKDKTNLYFKRYI